jgi:DNA (cytosine-5)-methyltransferase 1
VRYLSVCSGIEAATVAWHPLGWHPVAFSEIDKFPAAVLRHHYPAVPNYGDMTRFQEWPDAALDLLVGGTPCQSFSVAGLRKGLADPRGNLMLTYLAIADRYRPRWLVWENVPGVLSSNGGRDFGAFLGALAKLGYGFAYRVLDAQYFGLAQRRQRVFVVGHLGDWRRAAAVLLERESLSGHPAPRRDARQGSSADAARSIAPTLNAAFGSKLGLDNQHIDGGAGLFVSFLENQRADVYESNVTQALSKGGGKPGQGYPAIRAGMQVRRLTPRECERLQGFPDDYTLIPYNGKMAKDGPRYKALGNSMAVPCMAWIGRRVQLVEDLVTQDGDQVTTSPQVPDSKAA